MDSSISLKDQIWILCVCHHVSDVLYYRHKYVKKQGNLNCNKIIPAKLTVPQLVRKFTVFYQTQRFITVITRAHHMSLAFTRRIQ